MTPDVINTTFDSAFKHEIASFERDSVKLIKNTKGYQWELRVSNNDHAVLLASLDKLDAALKAKYGGAEKEGEDK